MGVNKVIKTFPRGSDKPFLSYCGNKLESDSFISPAIDVGTTQYKFRSIRDLVNTRISSRYLLDKQLQQQTLSREIQTPAAVPMVFV